MGLTKDDNLLIDTPKIPYRVLTDQEKRELFNYANKLPGEEVDRFWQQTQEEGRKFIKAIKEGGFVVGEEQDWGVATEGYGARVHIYPKNYDAETVQKSRQRDNIIGSVDLWEYGGFLLNPIGVWYQSPGVIDDVFELREFLIKENISFKDHIDRSRLKREISQLEIKRDNKLKLLDRLKDVKLR